MKKILLAAAAAPVMLAGAPLAAADTATGDLVLGATVPNTCFISRSPEITLTNLSGTPSGATGAGTASGSVNVTIDSASIIDPVTAAGIWTGGSGSNAGDSNRSAINVTFGAVCNFANAGVTFASAKGGLVNSNPPAFQGDFASGISYTVTGTFGKADMLTTTFRPGGGVNGGNEITGPGESTVRPVPLPTNGDMSLRIRLRLAHNAANKSAISELNRANFPFLSGTYADTLTVSFGANP